ncbi:DUF2809 domain-containing protein [Pedobacter sp. P351]|uniref:ribosomal maturation YjgA family protein n=1 Tax=Pedobacter superstes TaxID=3133441 RepID=UPI003096D3C3
MLSFKLNYFIASNLLFLTEVCIAVFAHDQIIGPYFGDLLVVILLYCLVKSFLDLPATITALTVLLFSYMLETLQYFNIVQLLGLGNSGIANIIIGNYFAWLDILAYTLGIILVLAIENLWPSKKYNHGEIRNTERVRYFI